MSIENPGPQVAPGLNGSAAAAVTIKVQDQYGNPFRGAAVFLDSSDETGTGDAVGSTITSRALVTGASGTVRMTYSYSGNASQETLRASWDGYQADDGSGSPVGTLGVEHTVTSTAQTEDKTGTTTVLWVLPSQQAAQAAVSVLSLDAESSQIVVDVGTDEPNSVNFDSNDFFIVSCAACGANNAGATRYLSMADFVAELTTELATAKATTDNDQPTLQWAAYVYDDSSNITSFTLALGGSR